MAATVLHPEQVDDFRREVEAGRLEGVLRFNPEGISLGAAIELACWVDARRDGLDPRVGAQLERWQRTHRALAAALDALHGLNPCSPEDFATPIWEIRAVPTREEFASRDSRWGLFGMRFARSLRDVGGFAPKLARALVGVVGELVDNVLEHAAPPGCSPPPGVVGFHVVQGAARFVIGDVGQGVLSSLRALPRHSHLVTAREALLAVVRDHATSRSHLAQGNGIKEVFARLAALRGSVRFRSADAALTVEGNLRTLPIVVRGSPDLRGLQVAVTCEPCEA